MLYTEDSEIDELLIRTFTHLGMESYIDVVLWRWNRRFRTCLGRAHYDDHMIQLSTHLWKRATPEVRANTVVHEACHLAANRLFDHQGHDEPWASLMLVCGSVPKQCHRILNYENKKLVFCKCEGGTHIGKIRHGRMQQGTKYRCAQCKASLRLSP